MKEYKFHEVAGLFPLLEGKPFNELVEDIKKNGLLEPIWLAEEQIVDGRNRYKACKKAGIEPSFRNWVGNGSLVSFVVSLNLKRRHLTKDQSACVVVDALPLYEKEAKKRQGTRTDIKSNLTGSFAPARDFAAKDFGVSSGYVANAKRLSEESHDVFEEVKAGKKNE